MQRPYPFEPADLGALLGGAEHPLVRGVDIDESDLVGTWRPRQSGRTFAIAVQPWGRLAASVRKAIAEQAERLAAYRGVALAGIDYAG